MKKKLSEFIKAVEFDGDSKEALSFISLIKVIEKEDKDFRDLIKEVPSIPAFLRAAHKAGFWSGTNYGKGIYLNAECDTFVDDT